MGSIFGDREQCAGQRGRGESKALVKCRFITGPIISPGKRAGRAAASLQPVLCSTPPREGQFGAGPLFSEGLLSDGPDTIIYQSLGARGAQGSPLN
ncbi:hypothetical protein VZT92_014314 [Zoarces viviparus]|uniref:Uncharacterized protein n=1 Tax=Zoarces viviparus TaxID=48416 RepID=A0AAW1EYS0_ZOAVI